MAIANRVDLDRFEAQGYLIVEDVLDPAEDLDPVVREYESVLDDLCDRWVADGTIKSAHRDLPFAKRFAAVLNEAGADARMMSYFDIALPFSGVTEQTPIHLGPAVFGLLTNA